MAPEAAVGCGLTAALVLGGTPERRVDRGRRLGADRVRIDVRSSACRLTDEIERGLEPGQDATANRPRQRIEALGFEPHAAEALREDPQLAVDHAEALDRTLEAFAMRIGSGPDARDLDPEPPEVGRVQRSLFDSVGKPVERS
jgi:hypothetical protein